MVEQKMELRKIRDFGGNIGDTFAFLQQNFKPLLKAFFAICGLFMLVEAIFSGIYQSRSMGGLLQQIISGRINTARYNNDNPYAAIFSFEYFMVILFMLLTFASMKVVVGAYLKYYLENDGRKPGIDDIWQLYKKYFFRVFLYSIPPGVLSIVGLIFCLAPGIYLWTVFVPFTYVIMMEDADFGTAFSRCFHLIKGYFWPTFFIYLVAGIIYYVSSSIISLVVGLVVGVAAYFTTKDVSSTVGIVTSFLNVFSFAFYIIFFLSAGLQYFSLTEQRDGTGILQRINNIGNADTSFDHTEEQY
ncbi:MAG TPA: hypothetical protein VL307_00270 [Chitinophagaceae bacterium]|nr:hypothetical protein [Chitinophagaceae bacterium]